MAKEFDSGVKTELRILKDFEDTLRELGPIADELETISEQLTEHKVSQALSHHTLHLLLFKFLSHGDLNSTITRTVGIP